MKHNTKTAYIDVQNHFIKNNQMRHELNMFKHMVKLCYIHTTKYYSEIKRNVQLVYSQPVLDELKTF